MSQQVVDEARSKDSYDVIWCQRQLALLERELAAIDITAATKSLFDFRQRLDDLIFFALGTGGSANETAAKADRLRDTIISDLRAAFADDQETLANIEKADEYHKDVTSKFYIPVIAQLLRTNSPIPKEETLPTILSSDPLVISVFMASMTEDAQTLVRAEATKMMQEALNNGYADPLFKQKLSALEGKWHFEQSISQSNT